MQGKKYKTLWSKPSKQNQENLYEFPIESSKLKIYKSTLDSTPSSLNLDDVFCKLLILNQQ